jgi:lipopolysaccharide/colanic/teichoic acid biosynthesis glycosyltransferase
MLKRLLDLLGAGFGLVITAPVLFVLFLLIRLESAGPALFVQKRVGLGGRDFWMYKLRSMRRDDSGSARLLTVGEDPRITRMGRFVRATKLDELPQLWNVFCGEMSLVGPRPEVRRYVDLYTLEQQKVLALKPGITDPASLAMFNESELLGRVDSPDEFYVRVLMPEKIRINLEYAARAGVGSDLLLIFATVGKIFGLRLDIFGRLGIALPNLGDQ